MSSQISMYKFNIMVVDDDYTSLNVIASMLRVWKYQVFTELCPVNALATARSRPIDLIVSDLHMPKLNGLQLQREIEAESKLPVIIMSSDDNEKIVLKSLSNGAVFFISKPVTVMDFKNIWQYAVAAKRDRSMKSIEKIGSIQAAGSLAIGKSSSKDENNSASSVNEKKRSSADKKNGRKKGKKVTKKNKEVEVVEREKPVAPKKPKVVWDYNLHNRFMQAIRFITLEKAVPKRILEFMNVTELTRENVASHLQKYRIFLKKVAKKGYGVTGKNSMSIDRTFRSSFAVGHSPLMLQNSLQGYSPFRGQEKQNSGLSSLSSSSSPFGFGQPCLLGSITTQANVHTPLLGNTNTLYQPNRIGGVGLGSTDIGTNMLSRGGAMSGTNSLQFPNRFNNISNPNFGTSEIRNPNVESTGTGNVSISDRSSNLNYFNNNYAGDLIATGGQMRLNAGGLNGAGSVGLIKDGAQAPGLGVGAVGDSTFGTCLAPGKSSSVGFNHGNYQSPTSFSGVNIEQGSTTSAVPSVAQQQFGLINNDRLDGNDNIASGVAHPRPFGEFANTLMESTNYQFPSHQQQGGEGVVNPNFGSNTSLFSGQMNATTSQPLHDLDFPGLFNVEENRPWDEPTLEQLQEIEELLNSSSEDDNENPSDDYHPVLDENTNQGQAGEDTSVNNELSGMFSSENAGSTGNQGWTDDDFINSLLSDQQL